MKGLLIIQYLIVIALSTTLPVVLVILECVFYSPAVNDCVKSMK